MLKGTLYAVMLTGFGAELECLVGRGVCVSSGCLWLGILNLTYKTELFVCDSVCKSYMRNFEKSKAGRNSVDSS